MLAFRSRFAYLLENIRLYVVLYSVFFVGCKGFLGILEVLDSFLVFVIRLIVLFIRFLGF